MIGVPMSLRVATIAAYPGDRSDDSIPCGWQDSIQFLITEVAIMLILVHDAWCIDDDLRHRSFWNELGPSEIS